MRLLLITLVSAVLATRLTGAEPLPAVTVLDGIPYSPADGKLTLDVFLPLASNDPVPCVIVIQGGGFFAQNGQRFRTLAQKLAESGFAAATIAYRGLPDHGSAETLADARAAVCFMRANAAKYHVDPDRIGAIGRSAGGAIALLIALDQNPPASQTAAVSSRVQAAVGIAGVYNFPTRYTSAEQNPPDTEVMRAKHSKWIGAPFAPDNPDWLHLSAVHHADAADPPVLLLHSKNDPTVHWKQSLGLHAALVKAGASAELHLTKTGGHAGPRDSIDRAIAFFRKTLQTSPPSTRP